MTLRYSEKLRNAGLDARIAAIGAAPTLRILGAGDRALLAQIKLPDVWMSKAENGSAHKLGNWATLALHKGEAKSFQICDAKGNVHMIGQIPLDMTLADPNIEPNQSVVVGSFDLFAGNG